MTKTIGIWLFDDFEELDAFGPWEVLSYWTQTYPHDGWAVTTFAAGLGPVTAAKTLRVLPHHELSDVPELDVLLYPGGHGTRRLLADPAHLAWLRDMHRRTEITASVCTGALVLAAAGLLRNRPATTHWSAYDELAALDPTTELNPDARWVDDGDIITAAGVSAGIDLPLALVVRLAGAQRAREVKRAIQYDPSPPV